MFAQDCMANAWRVPNLDYGQVGSCFIGINLIQKCQVTLDISGSPNWHSIVFPEIPGVTLEWYRKVANIRRTKSQNLNVSRLIL